MKLNVLNNRSAQIQLGGDIVSEVVGELKEMLDQTLSQGCTDISLDMSEVQYINSSGLSILVGIKAKLQKQNGKLLLANVSQDLMEFFESINLTEILSIENKT